MEVLTLLCRMNCFTDESWPPLDRRLLQSSCSTLMSECIRRDGSVSPPQQQFIPNKSHFINGECDLITTPGQYPKVMGNCSPVSTACTPGSDAALLVSTLRTRACAWGLSKFYAACSETDIAVLERASDFRHPIDFWGSVTRCKCLNRRILLALFHLPWENCINNLYSPCSDTNSQKGILISSTLDLDSDWEAHAQWHHARLTNPHCNA